MGPGHGEGKASLTPQHVHLARHEVLSIVMGYNGAIPPLQGEG